jgi:hypothetical protein
MEGFVCCCVEARNVQKRVNCYGRAEGMERRLQESSLHWAIQGRGSSAYECKILWNTWVRGWRIAGSLL